MYSCCFLHVFLAVRPLHTPTAQPAGENWQHTEDNERQAPCSIRHLDPPPRPLSDPHISVLEGYPHTHFPPSRRLGQAPPAPRRAPGRRTLRGPLVAWRGRLHRATDRTARRGVLLRGRLRGRLGGRLDRGRGGAAVRSGRLPGSLAPGRLGARRVLAGRRGQGRGRGRAALGREDLPGPLVARPLRGVARRVVPGEVGVQRGAVGPEDHAARVVLGQGSGRDAVGHDESRQEAAHHVGGAHVGRGWEWLRCCCRKDFVRCFQKKKGRRERDRLLFFQNDLAGDVARNGLRSERMAKYYQRTCTAGSSKRQKDESRNGPAVCNESRYLENFKNTSMSKQVVLPE